jgi:mono/diheme cytochrome c family protein
MMALNLNPARAGRWLGILAGLAAMPAAQAADAPLPMLSSGWHFEERDGASLYQAICQGCHMADGQGAVGAGRYPALAGNPRLASGVYLTRMVLHGRRAMPGLARGLDDEQVALVVNQVLSRFGPAGAPAVSASEVAVQRALPNGP